MGTMIDYAYLFSGSPEAVASARAAIKAYQAEYSDVSGNGNCDFDMKPTRQAGGALLWRFYATGSVEDFDLSIDRLTASSNLVCHSYWGTNDGYCASALNVFESGAWTALAEWRADIGIDAALAIRKLATSADAAALLALVAALRVAASDGWDDDDYPWLLKAAVVADAISSALSAHGDLVSDAQVVKALLGIKRALRDVGDDLRRLRAGKAAQRREVDRLTAAVEALEIAQAVPRPASLRSRRAMAL